jgi:hypothetical protein
VTSLSVIGLAQPQWAQVAAGVFNVTSIAPVRAHPGQEN